MYIGTKELRLTSEFVAYELAALDFADAGKQGAYLLLRHSLGQVINDEIRLGLLLRSLADVGAAILLHRVHSVRHHCTFNRTRLFTNYETKSETHKPAFFRPDQLIISPRKSISKGGRGARQFEGIAAALPPPRNPSCKGLGLAAFRDFGRGTRETGIAARFDFYLPGDSRAQKYAHSPYFAKLALCLFLCAKYSMKSLVSFYHFKVKKQTIEKRVSYYSESVGLDSVRVHSDSKKSYSRSKKSIFTLRQSKLTFSKFHFWILLFRH